MVASPMKPTQINLKRISFHFSNVYL